MNIFSSKGQAALEFMMTYGWAILVVLAAIGALSYFGILNPSRYTPDMCMGTTGFSCAGKPIVDNESIMFSMINGLGYRVKLDPDAVDYSATLADANCDKPVFCRIGNISCDSDPSYDPTRIYIEDGAGATVVIKGCNFNLFSVVKGEVKINYTQPQSQLTESIIISITGKSKSN